MYKTVLLRPTVSTGTGKESELRPEAGPIRQVFEAPKVPVAFDLMNGQTQNTHAGGDVFLRGPLFLGPGLQAEQNGRRIGKGGPQGPGKGIRIEIRKPFARCGIARTDLAIFGDQKAGRAIAGHEITQDPQGCLAAFQPQQSDGADRKNRGDQRATDGKRCLGNPSRWG